MRLVTFAAPDGEDGDGGEADEAEERPARRRVGAVVGDAVLGGEGDGTLEVVDVTAARAAVLADAGHDAPWAAARTETPPEMAALLARDGPDLERTRATLDRVGDREHYDGERVRYDRSEVALQAPLPRPNSIRDFMAFEEHVQNTVGEPPDVWYEMPVHYRTNPDTVVGPGADVPLPSYADRLDYELEFAAVIGERCRDVSEEDAMDVVAGYTVFDDFSERNIQLREMQGNLGPAKAKGFANALGPCLATPDEVDIDDAAMTGVVNGEEVAEGDTGDVHHDVAALVAHASDSEPLFPGDVLGSGTVGGGCGLENGVFLDPGDAVALSVEGVGTLRNKVVEREGARSVDKG